MFQIILNYLSVALGIQALIVFAEVLINFKRPFSLKSMILVIVSCIAMRGFGIIYCNYADYNRWIIELPGPFLGAAILSFFSIIYQNSIKKYVIIFGLVMVFTFLVIMSYYSFVEPIDSRIQLITIPGIGFKLKLLKLFFVTVAFALTVDLMRRIFRKFQPDNLYLIQLRRWSPYFLGSFLLIWTASLIRNGGYLDSYFYRLFSIVGDFIMLLLFLFRPKFLNRTSLRISLGDFFTRKTQGELSHDAFVEVFFTHSYFLKKETSVEELSKQLNVSPNDLANFIYKNYAMVLNDLVNKHRIIYFINLVSSGKYGHYTIDALAQESGFNSRHHLYKPFKKFHGGTPSDFMRSVAK